MKIKKQNKSLIFLIIILAAVIVALMVYWVRYTSAPGQLDSFAKCLDAKGAKMYGAFWCPHCQAQKALFGKSKNLIPYIECSTADRQQTEICKTEKIESYPTWKFATGTDFISGEKTLKELSEKTGCELK